MISQDMIFVVFYVNMRLLLEVTGSTGLCTRCYDNSTHVFFLQNLVTQVDT